MGAGERDVLGDTAPFIAASLVAWWTTVRPAAFGVAGSWSTRAPSLVALAGIALTAMVIVRGLRHLVAIALSSFVLPCAVTWVLGPENATALSDPWEVFVGAIAWTAIGVVLMRPRAVAAPRGAEGGRGPTIGAGDDVARVAMREVEAELVSQEPPPRLQPRQKPPGLAFIPLAAGAALSCAIGVSVMRIGSNQPDRAVLARIVGAAVAIALLSTAGDMVEVRYLPRKIPKAKTRVSRSWIAFAIAMVLLILGVLVLGIGKSEL